MYAITAIAVNRITGEPDYFLVQATSTDDGSFASVDNVGSAVVYKRLDFIDFLESVEDVVVLREGLAPQTVRVRYGTHGYRYVEAVESGRMTDALKRLPRFAFLNEASAADVNRLDALDRRVPGAAIPDNVLERYVGLGWVKLSAVGPELTPIGRALLAAT